MSNTTFLDTYLALRASSEAERKQRERERQALLNTMALAEAELAKPEYFGFLIERDRMGYLEALSQTKTTFRGINPHDPLNGIVANGEINPDFVMMLEKNFFKENSENLDKDELYFVRYEVERNKTIKWLKDQFEKLSINDELLSQEVGTTQEQLFQKIQNNEWVLSVILGSGKICVADGDGYLEKIDTQEFQETLPKKFCSHDKKEIGVINLGDILEKKQGEKEMMEKELQRKQDVEARNMLSSAIAIITIAVFFVIAMYIYRQVKG